MRIKELDQEVYQIDVMPFGYEKLISCYILNFEKKAVVETGPRSSIQSVFNALRSLGIDRLDYVFISHVHLDHAGGAGTLANRYGARVVCHSRGAKHVKNPERLWKASIEFSEINRLYGKPDSVDDGMVIAIDEDRDFDLGGCVLRAIRTEGHAPHHLSYFLDEKKILFSGDAAGMCIDGNVIPTTPAPFNLDEWKTSVRKMMELEPAYIAYTHFGMYPADKLLEKVLDMAERWAEIAFQSSSFQEFFEKLRDSDGDLKKFMDHYSYCDVMLKWVEYGFEGMYSHLRAEE